MLFETYARSNWGSWPFSAQRSLVPCKRLTRLHSRNHRHSLPPPHDRYVGLCRLLTSSMETILSGDGTSSPFENIDTNMSPTAANISLQAFITTALAKHSSTHQSAFVSHQRPSYWTLTWPRLVLLPPLILVGMNSAYQNRASIQLNIKDALETIKSFWTQWVFEPVRDILDTVRTGGDESAGRVVSKEGLRSDMDVSQESNSVNVLRILLFYSLWREW